jgi:hypothetical protein
MSVNLVRTKFSALAAKIEVTGGVDSIAGSPAAGDWIGSDCEVQFNPDVIELSEYTGTLDRAASITGGLKPRLRLRMPVRGSGAAATAPDFGKLLQACTFNVTATGAAIGAPTAATAGTTTTVTAAAPFAATAQLYRGMPLLATGDQTFTSAIVDYTVGRVITIGETRGANMTTSTLLQIPINNLYSPTSDESVYKTITLYFYRDGVLWTFVGCTGTASLELTTAGLVFINFDLTAVFGAKSTTALPAAAATAAAARALIVPPRLVGTKIQLNKANAQVRTLTINAGVNVTLPEDPEGLDGYGPAVPIERDVGGSMDPFINTSNTAALFTAFRNGTSMNLMALLGSTAGNRFAFTCPAVKAVAMDPGDRGGLTTHGITFQAEGADSAFYAAAF